MHVAMLVVAGNRDEHTITTNAVQLLGQDDVQPLSSWKNTKILVQRRYIHYKDSSGVTVVQQQKYHSGGTPEPAIHAVAVVTAAVLSRCSWCSVYQAMQSYLHMISTSILMINNKSSNLILSQIERKTPLVFTFSSL